MAGEHHNNETHHRPVYLPHLEVELLERYMPGGYHPVHLHDKLADGRYEIVHKLGYGTYSTVWLARDHALNCYVSIKIVAADERPKDESRILRLLSEQWNKQSNAHDHPPFTLLLDEFTLQGPNGQHKCLVSKPGGRTIASSKEDANDFMFTKAAARSIVQQLVRAVTFLHQHGIGHGG